jgi:hypothetical protein
MKAAVFTSRVERTDSGMRFHVIPLPDAVAARFLAAGHRRVIATLNGRAVRRAIQGSKGSGHHLVLGKAELRDCGIALGETVKVTLEPDPEPEAIDLSEEFREVLRQDAAARARWESFPTGRQRSLAHYLTGAKSSESRLKRAVEIAEKLRTHTLHGDRPRKNEGD